MWTGGTPPQGIYVGTGDDVVAPLLFNSGNTPLQMTHDGDSNFSVSMISADGAYTEPLGNEIGPYTGTTVLQVAEGDSTGPATGVSTVSWSGPTAPGRLSLERKFRITEVVVPIKLRRQAQTIKALLNVYQRPESTETKALSGIATLETERGPVKVILMVKKDFENGECVGGEIALKFLNQNDEPDPYLRPVEVSFYSQD